MADKRLSDDFAASDGKRELEIFLLTDAGRKEHRTMQETAAKERDDLRRRQDERREKDIEEAKRTIRAGKNQPQLVPPWRPRNAGPSAAHLDSVAGRIVDVRHEKEARDLHYLQRQREDDFLTKQREERLMREAADRPREIKQPDLSKTRRDLDNGRDRER